MKMDTFLHPAYAILGRLYNGTKFSLMAVLFGIPLYLAAFAQPGPLRVQLGIASVFVLLYMCAGFYRQAMKGWNEVLPQLQRLSSGDLGVDFDSQVDRVGHFAEVARIVGTINGHFGRIVRQAMAGADQVEASSREIAAGSADLSRRTESQACTLEQISASVEELSATVRQNAHSCTTARALAEQANEVARQGQEMVAQMAETMAGIRVSSQQVVRVVAVIEGIAFRTNILALNAAVEAAKAAQHGRGFAVVAGEVRSLAHRSAQAAKDIKALIEDSVGSVEAAAGLVEQTGATIEEAALRIDEASGRVAEIAVASQEQSNSVDEVGRSLAQLGQLTQGNASAVRNTAGASDSLAQSADGLSASIRRFRL
jgi:methyl-accepting chemotaxis protein